MSEFKPTQWTVLDRKPTKDGVWITDGVDIQWPAPGDMGTFEGPRIVAHVSSESYADDIVYAMNTIRKLGVLVDEDEHSLCSRFQDCSRIDIARSLRTLATDIEQAEVKQ